jgi:hypothetical protein
MICGVETKPKKTNFCWLFLEANIKHRVYVYIHIWDIPSTARPELWSGWLRWPVCGNDTVHSRVLSIGEEEDTTTALIKERRWNEKNACQEQMRCALTLTPLPVHQKLFNFKQLSYKYFQESDQMIRQSCHSAHPYLTICIYWWHER